MQSRIKELEKIERIEVPEEEATIHFSFPQPPASGRTVIEVTQPAQGYPTPDGGQKVVLEDVSFTIERGDRIALVGANGAGKSTLIRMLSGLEEPTSGKIRLGHNVLADYFAQDQYKVLDGDGGDAGRHHGQQSEGGCGDAAVAAGMLHVLGRRRVQEAGRAERRGTQSVCDGEDAGVALRTFCCWTSRRTISICARRMCCWMRSANFSGTVMFVSHDRYFIDGLATRVFEVEDRRVHIYPGQL